MMGGKMDREAMCRVEDMIGGKVEREEMERIEDRLV